MATTNPTSAAAEPPTAPQLAAGSAAEALMELENLLFEFTQGSEPISQLLDELWKEIRGSPLEFFLAQVLQQVQAPEAMLTGESRRNAGEKSRNSRLGNMLRFASSSRSKEKERRKQRVRPMELLIQGIERVSQGLQGKQYDSIRSKLAELRKLFERARENYLMGKEPDARPKISLRRGTYYLRDGIVERVAPVDSSGVLVRTNDRGVHKVTNHGGVFFKFSETFTGDADSSSSMADLGALAPSHPGIEYAVDSLNKLVAATGTSPPTTILAVTRGGRRYIALASQSVTGESLESLVLGKVTPAIISKISGLSQDEAATMYEVMEQSWLVIDKVPLWSRIDLTRKNPLQLVDDRVKESAIMDFFTALAQQCRSALERIDTRSYSVMVVLSMLTNPSDAKLDNYIAVKNGDGDSATYSIVSIDNDDSFIDSVLSLSVGHLIGSRSVLFTFPQMARPLHQGVCDWLATCEPAAVVQNWLKDLMMRNREYEHLVQTHVLSAAELELLNLPQKLVPGTASLIMTKLRAMKELATQRAAENQPLTGLDVLGAANPLLHRYYAMLLKYSTDSLVVVANAFDHLFGPRTPMIEDFLSEELDKKLIGDSTMRNVLSAVPRFRDFVSDRTQTPAEMYADWLGEEHLFDGLDLAFQTDLVNGMIGEDCSSVTLHDCAALNDSLFLTVIQNSKSLLNLTCVRCDSITDRALFKLLVENLKPNKLTLKLLDCGRVSAKAKVEMERKDPNIIVELTTRDVSKKPIATLPKAASPAGATAAAETVVEVVGEEKSKKQRKKKHKKKKRGDDDDDDDDDDAAVGKDGGQAAAATAAAATVVVEEEEEDLFNFSAVDEVKSDDRSEYERLEEQYQMEDERITARRDALRADRQTLSTEKQTLQDTWIELKMDNVSAEMALKSLIIQKMEIELQLKDVAAQLQALLPKTSSSSNLSGSDDGEQTPGVNSPGRRAHAAGASNRIKALQEFFESGGRSGDVVPSFKVRKIQRNTTGTLRRATSTITPETRELQEKQERLERQIEDAIREQVSGQQSREQSSLRFHAFEEEYRNRFAQIEEAELSLDELEQGLFFESMDLELKRQEAMRKREEELEAERRRLADEQRQLVELKKKMDEDRRKMDEERREMEKKLEEIREQEKRLKELEKKGDEKSKAERLEMARKLAAMQAEAAAHQAAADAEKQRVAEMEAQLSKRDAEMNAQMRKMEAASAAAAAAAAAAAVAHMQAANAKGREREDSAAASKLKKELSQLEKTLKAKEKDLSAALAASERYQAAVDAERASLTKLGARVSELEAANEALKAELKKARSKEAKEDKAKEKEDKVKEKEDKKEEKKEEKKVREELQSLRKQLSQCPSMDEFAAVKSELEETRRKNEDLQSSSAALSKAASNEDLAARAALERDVKVKEKEIMELRKKLNKAESSAKKASQKNKSNASGGDVLLYPEMGTIYITSDDEAARVSKLKGMASEAAIAGALGLDDQQMVQQMAAGSPMNRRFSMDLSKRGSVKSGSMRSKKTDPSEFSDIHYAMESFKYDSEELHVEAVTAVWRLTVGSVANKNEIGRLRGIEVMMQGISRYAENRKFVARASGALFQLMKSDENRNRYLGLPASASAILASACKQYKKVSSIMKMLIRVLYLLVAYSKNVVETLQKYELSDTLAQLHEIHANDKDIDNWVVKLAPSFGVTLSTGDDEDDEESSAEDE